MFQLIATGAIHKDTAFWAKRSAGDEESSLINLGSPSQACGSSCSIRAGSGMYPGDRVALRS